MKEFLSQRGIPYTEKYVDQDRAAAIEMIRRSGQQGVPVTVIGDQIVVGFDRPRLERILASMAVGATAGSGRQAADGRKPLGVKVADASRYSLPGGAATQGAYIGAVHAGSPAEAAGMRVGDIIVSVGDTPIASVDDLTATLSKRSPGPMSFTIRRGAQTRTVMVQL